MPDLRAATGRAGGHGETDAPSKAALDLHEPDEMGVWSDSADIVWLPRSLYPKRIMPCQRSGASRE